MTPISDSLNLFERLQTALHSGTRPDPLKQSAKVGKLRPRKLRLDGTNDCEAGNVGGAERLARDELVMHDIPLRCHERGEHSICKDLLRFLGSGGTKRECRVADGDNVSDKEEKAFKDDRLVTIIVRQQSTRGLSSGMQNDRVRLRKDERLSASCFSTRTGTFPSGFKARWSAP